MSSETQVSLWVHTAARKFVLKKDKMRIIFKKSKKYLIKDKCILTRLHKYFVNHNYKFVLVNNITYLNTYADTLKRKTMEQK